MSDPVVEIIGLQRRRLVGAILGHAEREFYPDLTEDQQKAFRAKVLGSVGSFSDFVIDVVHGTSQGSWVNDEVIELLAEVNRQVRNLRAE